MKLIVKIAEIDHTGSVKRRSNNDCFRTLHTVTVIEQVKELVLYQEMLHSSTFFAHFEKQMRN